MELVYFIGFGCMLLANKIDFLEYQISQNTKSYRIEYGPTANRLWSNQQLLFYLYIKLKQMSFVTSSRKSNVSENLITFQFPS